MRVLIVVKPGNGESLRTAGQMRSALGDLGPIGRLPHEESVVDFTDAAGVSAQCRAAHAAIDEVEGDGVVGTSCEEGATDFLTAHSRRW